MLHVFGRSIPVIPWYTICYAIEIYIYNRYIMLYTFDISWFVFSLVKSDSTISSKELSLTSKPSLNASLYNLPVTKGVFIIILMSHGTTVTWGKKKVPFGSEKNMASFVSKTLRLTWSEFFEELRRFAVWKRRWQIQVDDYDAMLMAFYVLFRWLEMASLHGWSSWIPMKSRTKTTLRTYSSWFKHI